MHHVDVIKTLKKSWERLVKMVGSIGSISSSIFQQYQGIQNSSEAYSTKQAQSFDELVGNGTISAGEEVSSSTGITSMGGGSESSGSSSSNSEMDLNNDGQVTIDEIMRYTAMQMMEKMKEQMASDEGSQEMSQQDAQNPQQQKVDVESFKTQMAAQAYQMGENLLSAAIGSVTGSIAV